MATSTRSGDVLAGRYRLIDLLSESGGGRFWRAHDSVLERFVALHVISEDDPRADGLVAAARRSAQVLDSRILRVLDAERTGGCCCVVNEWGTGISLDVLVTNAGPLSPRNAAWLVHVVADAIAAAHDAGVTHGRLNPENVLIDRFGAVRVIGLCVDAALHGLPPGEPQADLEDLGGLLYCALTATWPGPSGSIVPAAPRENDEFLSPRQVRAGVPKPLDQLWRAFDAPDQRHLRRRHARDRTDISSARTIAAELLAFVGDPTGMPEALAHSIPAVNELRPVWLPALHDPLPHDSSADDLPVVPALVEDEPATGGEPGQDVISTAERPPLVPDTDTDTDAGTGTGTGTDTGLGQDPPIPLISELPTEAGMPVFGDDDVEWLRTRSNPPPPPPPFEDIPSRPLFAPDLPDGSPARRPRPDFHPDPHTGAEMPALPQVGFWPWDPDAAVERDEPDADAVPGRSWLRLAMAVGTAVLLLVAVVTAFNLGRGRSVLGTEPENDPSAAATAAAPVLAGLNATDLDPLGDGEERPEDLANLIDGDRSTTWSTQTYTDQLSTDPNAFKAGVGVVLDLGRTVNVTSVEVRVGSGQTAFSLYMFDTPPTTDPTTEPGAIALAATRGSGRLILDTPPSSAESAANRGRYLVLWLTEIPEVDGGFRAEIAEVVVRGEY